MAADPTCPRCGQPTNLGAIHGLCAACLARGAGDLLDLTEPAPPDDLPPGVPGYDLHRPLGIGGMGQVFEATDTATGEAAAVKILATRWTADEEAAARFTAEAEALRLLEHANIVRIRSTGTTEDGRLFIAMELVAGGDLGRLLRMEKVEPDRALDIFLKVCAALTHAHTRGIVHRDVKPSNILIGRDGTVKLADFGLAKHLVDEFSHYGIGSLTQTRDTFGTPYYIAPEALRGRPDPTPAADVYAAGVLLYHLLTGSPPLGNYTPLSQAANLPRSMDAALAGALQADPAKRSANLSVLVRGMESARDAAVRGSSRKKQKLLATGIAAAVALASTAWIAGWRTGRPAPPPPPPVYENPQLATASHPWTNSLGMKFAPAGGEGLLFSIWETRRCDYESFFSADRGIIPAYRAAATGGRVRASNVKTLTPEGWQNTHRNWREPGFEQSGDHPVVGVAVYEASIFCAWLTWQERTAGRLPAPAHYRLPTDLEWSAAAGLPLETGATPRQRNAALTPSPALIPGNYAGPEAALKDWPATWPHLAPSDSFPRTAPAGSFPPLPSGLYDMGGNVGELVDEIYSRNIISSGTRTAEMFTIRGGSWSTGATENLRPDDRHSERRLQGIADTGFRCILDLNEEAEPLPADE